MERLIADANAWGAANGGASDLTIDSYSDVITAIQQVQEAQGIAGNAEMENSKTVSGSIESVKKSWDNLLTGMGSGNADISKLMGDFLGSVGTAAENVIPLMGTILTNMGTAIAEYAPTMLSSALTMMEGFVSGAGDKMPEVLPKLVALLGNLAVRIVSHAPKILAAALKMFTGLVKAIPGIAGSLRSTLANLISRLPEVIRRSVGAFKTAGGDLMRGLVNGIGSGLDWVKTKIQEVCSNAVDTLKRFFKIASPSKLMFQMGGFITQGLANGIEDGGRDVSRSIGGINDDIYGGITATSPQAATSSYSAGGIATAQQAGGIVIQNMTVHAEDVLTMDRFVGMMRSANMQFA